LQQCTPRCSIARYAATQYSVLQPGTPLHTQP
jgi:hypothetical protein